MLGILRKTLSALTPAERRVIAPLVFLMFVSALLDSLSVAMVVPIVVGFLDLGRMMASPIGDIMHSMVSFSDERFYLAALIVALIFLFIAKNAFLVLQEYVQYSYSARVRERVQNELLRYHTMQPYAFFLNADSGDVLRTITVDSDYFYTLLNYVLRFLTDFVVISVLVIVVFAIDPRITLTLAIVVALEYAFILKVVRPFLRRYGSQYRKALGRGNGQIIELLRGIKTIKVGDKERFFERRYAAEVHEITQSRLMEQAFSDSPKRIIEAMTVTALFLFLLVMLFSGGDLAQLVPTLSAFVVAAVRMLPSVGRLSGAVSSASYYEGSLDKVKAISDELARMGDRPADELVVPSFEHELQLEHIHFSYPGSDVAVLDDASLTIRHNQSVGIVGPSGAGKTTLVDILLGLLSPQSGAITVDGRPFIDDEMAWHRLFAYIPQSIFMLNGSIWENILFGTPADRSSDAVVARVWQALEAAQLADFVRSTEDGLDTQIGEAGVRLSGGQIQRLGIARALFVDAPILVFDEATSALDYPTEEALMEAISNLQGKKTLVIVAHRLQTIANCDVVYRVEDGKVVQVEVQADESMRPVAL